MSGKPNSTEITALLMNIQRINGLRDSIKRRVSLIESENKAVESERDEVNQLLKKCDALISGMDVRTDGNYGFEGRYHWFLLELVSQAESGK